MLRYPVKLSRDDNGTFLVTAPDFPEVATFGEDEARGSDPRGGRHRHRHAGPHQRPAGYSPTIFFETRTETRVSQRSHLGQTGTLSRHAGHQDQQVRVGATAAGASATSRPPSRSRS